MKARVTTNERSKKMSVCPNKMVVDGETYVKASTVNADRGKRTVNFEEGKTSFGYGYGHGDDDGNGYGDGYGF